MVKIINYLFVFLVVAAASSCLFGAAHGAVSLTDMTCYVSANVSAIVDLCGDSASPCTTIGAVFDSLLAQGQDLTTLNLTIQVSEGYFNSTGNTNLNVFAKSLTIIGTSINGTSATTIGGDQSVFFVVAEPANSDPSIVTALNITDINFVNASAATTQLSGSVVYADITNTTFSLYARGCSFSQCAAKQNGGVFHLNLNSMYPDNANLSRVFADIKDSQFVSNSAGSYGGAINALLAQVRLERVTFQSNNASDGGAIRATGFVRARDTVFSSNNVTNEGGAVLLTEQHIAYSEFSHCSFNQNYAITGGAISGHQTQIHLHDSNFTVNSAITGGAINLVAPSSQLNVSKCSFYQNQAEGQGGAIYQDNESIFVITLSKFSSNDAMRGGAILFSQSSGYVDGTLFESNTATSGGAIFTQASDFTLSNSTINGNSAYQGGSIYCSDTEITIPSSVIIENNVDQDNTTSSDSAENQLNEYNIYCSLIPEYTFCKFIGDDNYVDVCGEVKIPPKDSLPISKLALAFIIIGGVIFLGLVAFGVGCLLARSTDKGDKNYAPVLDAMNTGTSEDEAAKDRSTASSSSTN